MVYLTNCDYSVFYDNLGITVSESARGRQHKVGYTLSLWKDGVLVHTTEMYVPGNPSVQHILGSAVAFMTDYGVCESEEILEQWYEDPRIEYLGYYGFDIEGLPAYEQVPNHFSFSV